MTKKIICVILIISSLFFICCEQTFAATTVDSVFSGADDFLKKGKGTLNAEQLNETSDIVFNLFLAFGIIAAVAIGITIGIKFMLASVEEKAKVKEVLVPYVISCVVIFGAFGIWKLMLTILSGFAVS